MLAVGVLYLAYDKNSWSPGSRKAGTARSPKNSLSRVILGVQVGLSHMSQLSLTNLGKTGLIALAMLVTRSSVASLQAKQGLPVGTQVVGWLVLGLRSWILGFYAN